MNEKKDKIGGLKPGENPKPSPPPQQSAAPATIKPPQKPKAPATVAKVAAALLLHFAFCILHCAAQVGGMSLSGTASTVYTDRLSTTLSGSGVTNVIYYTNAAVAFGNTNAIHIRTNATTGRWEWHTDWATRVATNTANRPTGTWQTAVASPALYGYTRYTPQSVGTISTSPGDLPASTTTSVKVDTNGVIVNPANFFAANVSAILATNRFSVRISSRGIANSLSSITNDGMNFGPDTPGTTTCGIQEAWDSFFKGTNYGPFMPSMVLEFGDGYFFYTNHITISNLYNSAIVWRGKGKMATTLVNGGSTAGITNIVFRGGDNTNSEALDLPLHIRIEGMGFSSVEQHTNIMLYVGGMAFGWLEDVLFTGWNMRTNQASGASLTQVPSAALLTERQGLVGAFIKGGLDAGLILRDIFFNDLAVGIRTDSDHVEANGIRSSIVSYWPTGGVAQHTNKWSTNSIYSLGAVVIRENSTYDSHWTFGNCYAARVGFAYIGSIAHETLDSWAFESCDYPVVSDSVFAPTLRDPSNLSGDIESLGGYIVKTPTATWDGATNNGYLLTSTPHPRFMQYGSFPNDNYDLPFYVRQANTNLLVINHSGEAVFSGKVAGAEQPFAELYGASLTSSGGLAGTNIFASFTSGYKTTNSLYGFSVSTTSGSITNSAEGWYDLKVSGLASVPTAATSFFFFTNGIRTHIGLPDVGALTLLSPITMSGKIYLPANCRVDVRNYGDDPDLANIFFSVSKQ